MKLSTIKYLILSLLIFAAACHVPKDCLRTNTSIIHAIKPIIALDSSAPVLYSADFDVMKYHFSGLIAFRKMIANNETRIVFLTETGIRMMEFKYSDNKIENTFCMDAVKKKLTVKFIGRFIQMLLTEPDCKGLCVTQQNSESNYFCKTKNGYYTFKLNNGVKENALLLNGKNKQAEAKYIDSQTIPDEIKIIMPLHTNIQMKRAINAFK
jgi:hypothetical protein